MFLQSLRTTPIEDTAYGPSWDGAASVGASKNALYDKIETLVSDAAYGAGWNGDADTAPSKNATYDKIETLAATIAGFVSDAVYDSTFWDGVTTVAPSKNAVRDVIESYWLNAQALISNVAFGGTWDGDTQHAPSKEVLWEKLNSMSASVDDVAYDKTTWDGQTGTAPSKNAVRDKFESLAPNITGALVDDTAYDEGTWNGVAGVAPSKNAVRDKIESLAASLGVSDTAYAGSWDGATTTAPSQNAVYDKIESLKISIGSYTPTLTAVSNVASHSASLSQYVRISDFVIVCGYIGIDPTATGGAQLAISLPVTSNLGAFTDCLGVIMSDSYAQGGSITGDATNNRALVVYSAVNAGNSGFGFVFGYKVI